VVLESMMCPWPTADSCHARVADDQRVATHGFMTRTGKVELLEMVAFVENEAAFHRHDGFAAERAANRRPACDLTVEVGKLRDFFVGDGDIGMDISAKRERCRG